MEARTGGRVTLRTAVIRGLIAQLMSRTVTEFGRPAQRRQMKRLQALAPILKEIQEQHSGDRQAQQDAVMAFYQQNEINPFKSCFPLLAAHIAVHLPLPWPNQWQTLPDHLAGIIVVRDHRHGRPRH